MIQKGFPRIFQSRLLRRIVKIISLVFLTLVILIGGLFTWALTATDTSLLARGLIWGDADVNDWQRLPNRSIKASLKPVQFPTTNKIQITELLNQLKIDDTIPFRDFLQYSDTTAFIIIHGNELVYEEYFNGSSREATQSSQSVAKSFLSTLVGIGIDEGYIGGLDEPVTDYIPELLDRDEKFADITIRHLITMSSGLRFVREWSPYSDNSITYYDPDLRAAALSSEIVESPGVNFHYNDYNPLLVGMVLERATGVPVAEYLETRLWQPMGAEGDGSWSLDSERSGFEKMNTGVNGRAIDLAKLGWLFLNHGRNGDKQVIPVNWVDEATRLDNSTDPALHYQYYWWIDVKHNAYWAEGNFGQSIYVYPEADLVLVRMGDTGEKQKYVNVNWTPKFLRSVAQYLQDYFKQSS